MKPTPCPSRLEEFIALANLEPDSEAHKTFQTIAQAFREKRQQQNKADLVVIASPFAIQIDLNSGKIWGVYDGLALALDQTESESSLDRIRECPVCSEVFWAGRVDAEACPKHAARLRKRNQRRKEKERKAKRAKERARRAKSKRRLDRPLSPTSLMILEAIANQQHLFETIDEYCYRGLNWRYRKEPTRYSKPTVIKCLKLLVDAEYVAETEREVGGFYYTLRNKAKKLFESPTH